MSAMMKKRCVSVCSLFGFALFSLSSLAFAADDCVKAGESVVVSPNSPTCCAGLKLVPAPAGTYGSAGTCQAEKTCMTVGESVAVSPKALPCCAGLELMPAASGVLGSAGTCSKKSVALVACESKVTQIEQILATKNTKVDADLADQIKKIVQPGATKKAPVSGDGAEIK